VVVDHEDPAQLSLPSAAALTSQEHEITLVDEQIDDLPWDEPHALQLMPVSATAARMSRECR